MFFADCPNGQPAGTRLHRAPARTVAQLLAVLS